MVLSSKMVNWLTRNYKTIMPQHKPTDQNTAIKNTLSMFLPDQESTEKLAKALAAALQDSNTANLSGRIHLIGDLGAGKTCFTRAFLRSCGVTGRVKSPSYALLETYNVSSNHFYHLDFYRFSDASDWVDAGFRDILEGDGVVLIEWPEKAGDLLPKPDIDLNLEYLESGRQATLTSYSNQGMLWLNYLKNNMN